jgi:NAD(P)-dependent dehydrogenase (short-subunit alcohol dehydrogenase family)
MTDTAARPSATPSFSLGDRYSTVSGEILATGVQALTRLPLDQMRADRRAGHNTAAFISGYQGSPLGGYDRELQSQRPLLDELGIVHRPAVNEELGATAAPGDCSSDAGVRALVETATEALGRIDVYLANAGIDRTQPDSLQASDEDWARMIDTNVMAHVRAARVLVPAWLADSQGGRFVVTASAAGLLTMIGAAPYSVTKHAAVGFA